MLDHDQIRRFLIKNTSIRGQLISLDASWQEMQKRVQVSGKAANILGEAVCAISLLASTIKIEGKITLQIRGQGDLHLLVAQATSDRALRGLIRGESEVKSDDRRSIKELFQTENLIISIDSGGDKPYQGIVPLMGNSLTDVLKSYLHQSDQLPTQLWLACNENSVSGLLLQKLPDDQSNPGAIDEHDDDWERVQILADTLKEEELLDLSVLEILHRLFHEDDLQLFDPDPMRFQCGCSRERSGNIIRSIGRKEADDILRERDDIEIVCEFCNQAYRFDAVDVDQLFNPQVDLHSNPSVKH